MPDELFRGEPIGLSSILVNLGLVLVLGQILVWHYLRFSPVLSNKRKLARVFVFIAATTLLVISVVKTSLALSLGLVGALSIIRFRTPIKEPEELAYLFLSIGLGLGLGADQPLITVIVFTGILVYMGLLSAHGSDSLPPRMLVHVAGDLPADHPESAEGLLRELVVAVEPDLPRVDLRRVDTEGSSFQATLVLDLERSEQVGQLLSRIRRVVPNSSVSVVDGNGLE